MSQTELGRVSAKVSYQKNVHGFRTSPEEGYVAVILPNIVNNRANGVILKTYGPNGEELGFSYIIKASVSILEAALKAATKEIK